MGCKCKRPNIIKNKYISSRIGAIGILLAVCFISNISGLSVYITSFIHLKQDFVTMHYGYFFYLILDLSTSFSQSFGGMLESKIGFTFTTLLGTLIVAVGDGIIFKMQNIWVCYAATLVMGVGFGIATSLLVKNLTLYKPKSKGIITSFFQLYILAFNGGYLITGEKVIAQGGETLKEGQEFYTNDIAERTYIYFMIGFFAVPFGDLIFLLFTYEYKETKDKGTIVPQNNPDQDDNKENNENKNVNEQINDADDEQNEKNDEKKEEELNEKEGEAQETSSFLEELQKSDSYIKKKIKKVLKTWRFWRLALTTFLLSFPMSFLNITGRTYGALIGINGEALQYLVLSQAGGITLFVPFLGCLSDKKSPVVVLIISSILAIIPGILLYFWQNYTFVYMAALTINGIGDAAKRVSLNPLLMEIYGIRESVILSGIINGFGTLNEVINIISAFVVSIFYPGKEIESRFKLIFIAGCASAVLSLILFFFESKKPFDYLEENNDSSYIINSDENNQIESDKLI